MFFSSSFGMDKKRTRKAANGDGLIYNERRQEAKAEVPARVLEGQNGSSASAQAAAT
jgi:hypothetical protein